MYLDCIYPNTSRSRRENTNGMFTNICKNKIARIINSRKLANEIFGEFCSFINFTLILFELDGFSLIFN